MKKHAIYILMLFLSTAFIGCEENDHSENEENISKNFDDESHKTGQDCMECHLKGGNGEGWFSVAGTVYDSLQTTISPNGLIKLFTTPGNPGDPVATIEVDALGNFFTTESIDLTNGLYVSVVSSGGKTKPMITPVYNGSCNFCHEGNVIDRIWVE